MDRDIHGDHGSMQQAPGRPLFNLFAGNARDLANLMVREAFNEAGILPELLYDGYHEIIRLVHRLFYYWKRQLGLINDPEYVGTVTFENLADMVRNYVDLAKIKLGIEPATDEGRREESRHMDIMVAANNIMFHARQDIQRYIHNYPCLHQDGFQAAGKKLILTYIHCVDHSKHDVPDRLIMSVSILMEYYYFYSNFAKQQRMDPINLWIDFFLIHFLKQCFDHNFDTVDTCEKIDERYNLASLSGTPEQAVRFLPYWEDLLQTFKELAEVRDVPMEQIIQKEVAVRRQVLPYFEMMDPEGKLYRPHVPSSLPGSDDESMDEDDDSNDTDDDYVDIEEEFVLEEGNIGRHYRGRRRRPARI